MFYCSTGQNWTPLWPPGRDCLPAIASMVCVWHCHLCLRARTGIWHHRRTGYAEWGQLQGQHPHMHTQMRRYRASRWQSIDVPPTLAEAPVVLLYFLKWHSIHCYNNNLLLLPSKNRLRSTSCRGSPLPAERASRKQDSFKGWPIVAYWELIFSCVNEHRNIVKEGSLKLSHLVPLPDVGLLKMRHENEVSRSCGRCVTHLRIARCEFPLKPLCNDPTDTGATLMMKTFSAAEATSWSANNAVSESANMVWPGRPCHKYGALKCLSCLNRPTTCMYSQYLQQVRVGLLLLLL